MIGKIALLHVMMLVCSVLIGTVQRSVYAANSEQPSLDELLDIDPGPTKPKGPSDKQPLVEPEVKHLQQLSIQQAAEVFTQLINEMRLASDRLGRDLDPGLGTQRIQESVLTKLDQVIATTRRRGKGSPRGSPGSPKQGQKQESGSARSTGKQQEQSADEKGAQRRTGQEDQPAENKRGLGGGSDRPYTGVNTTTMRENRAEWGNLPPRLRDELIQGTAERFSLIYRELTEQYYRRLAEQSK